MTPEELGRIRVEASQITLLAVSYACPLLIGRPPAQAESINSGSGIVVELNNTFFFFTAAHLLTATRSLKSAQPDIAWHLASDSDYATFDPETRVVLCDEDSDLLILELTAAEALAPAKTIYRPAYWPPDPVKNPEYVFVCGYPGVERIQEMPRYWSFAPACIGGALDSVNSRQFGIYFERTRWITYKDGIVPTLGPNLGGMSGGPIFSFRGFQLTLVGIVSEHSPGFDILFGVSLDGITTELLSLT